MTNKFTITKKDKIGAYVVFDDGHEAYYLNEDLEDLNGSNNTQLKDYYFANVGKKVEKAKKELKYHLQITKYHDKAAALDEIKQAAQNPVNALEEKEDLWKELSESSAKLNSSIGTRQRTQEELDSIKEPKTDMKEKSVDTVESLHEKSIWKDVSELPKQKDIYADIPCIVEDALGYHTYAVYSVNAFWDLRNNFTKMERGYLSSRSLIKYCTLTDFINQQEQTAKKVAELEKLIKEIKND